MRKALVIAALLLLLAVGAAATYFLLPGTSDSGDATDPPTNLPEHLIAEQGRLKAHQSDGSLSDSEQAIIDGLGDPDDPIEFQKAFVRTLAAEVHLALRDQSVELGSHFAIRFTHPGPSLQEEYEFVCRTALGLEKLLSKYRASIESASTDTVDPHDFGAFMSVVGELRTRLEKVAESGHISFEQERPEIHRDALQPLSELICLHERLLALSGSDEVLDGTVALWMTIDRLPKYDASMLDAQTEAVARLLANAHELIDERLLKLEDFNKLTGKMVHWPSLADRLLRPADDLQQYFFNLSWMEVEDPNAALFLEDLLARHGFLPLQQWIDAEKTHQLEVCKEHFRLAYKVDNAGFLGDIKPAQQLLAEAGDALAAQGDIVASWLKSWMESFYLQVLRADRSRLRQEDASASDVAHELSLPQYVTVTQAGEVLEFRFNPAHPLAKYYPAECREAFASTRFDN